MIAPDARASKRWMSGDVALPFPPERAVHVAEKACSRKKQAFAKADDCRLADPPASRILQ
jgi:hypothetical protein